MTRMVAARQRRTAGLAACLLAVSAALAAVGGPAHAGAVRRPAKAPTPHHTSAAAPSLPGRLSRAKVKITAGRLVASGTAQVTCGKKIYPLRENQSTYIPLGEKHRLENFGPEPLHLIEVQSGAYLGEDDIVRFEDTYGRS